LATLEGNLGEFRGELSSNNTQLVHLRELEREAGATRSVYESFLQRYHEISDQARMGSSDLQLVSSAAKPTSPSSPNVPFVLSAAMILSICLCLSAGFVLEVMRDGLASADEVERKIGVPPVTSVPALKLDAYKGLDVAFQHPAGYVVKKPMSVFAETVRVLRNSIVYANMDNKVKVVALTSAVPDEG